MFLIDLPEDILEKILNQTSVTYYNFNFFKSCNKILYTHENLIVFVNRYMYSTFNSKFERISQPFNWNHKYYKQYNLV